MDNKPFKLVAPYELTGDQPKALEQLLEGVKKKHDHQVLLGATGTGKTFIMANVINQLQKPTIVLAHNKTLAAQLWGEFKEFFPENAVNYFVSYYDYYQPEAYIARSDTYIEKDASINEEIDKYRHAATKNLLTRRDVIIVASVSCIYGLGDVEEYGNVAEKLETGMQYKREKLLRHLADLQYKRNDIAFTRSTFRAHGDVVEIYPTYSDTAIRISFFGDEIETLDEFDTLTGEIIGELKSIEIYPAKHTVTSREKILKAVEGIKLELDERTKELTANGKIVEAQRLKQRTEYDIEMLIETGYCSGIENYTRYLSNRAAGEQPATLLDYFPDDYLMFIDESHITVPQIGGMHNGNLARKKSLIDYGFRMPSAYDNRPLRFDEFEKQINKVVYVSATPREYEIKKSENRVIEQLIRPTGLLDPEVTVKPTQNQVDDLLLEIRKRIKANERVLVTTLTKRMSEDLTEYLQEAGIKVKYLHSDIETLVRLDILRDLRLGEIEVIVGINLLREGLDLPEVSLVAILDADKEGFLRSDMALIQTIGRAARNAHGQVIMYADRMTEGMKKAISETNRRRKIQAEYNEKHGITPQTIIKEIKEIRSHQEIKQDAVALDVPQEEIAKVITQLELAMDLAASKMDFEKAAELRDQIDVLQEKLEKKKH
ncbi:MAG: excinuclease ABC subunit B [Candidatus Abawacabacteria bacterium RBG_16_42_10]|uniref:UvrABC system protein B n=1 Tax=Candidatus Abawacabacteria bacterium RBG_16_42_10 TaxID=1817814 RepID=A0A1F4XJR4_9BACT|nr:MAG: excinuclease ABC subunit B [Candidatus Abawacabacteria bacterium RBG_16_42_10]